ncbi:MAG: HEPN domain-containing protein [Chloroflexota bacterium]
MKRRDFDVDGYAKFLKEKSIEDFEFAKRMLKWQKMGYCLFWAHAALQKTMAVIICKETRKMPPWRKDLTRLARLANVELTKDQRELCKILNFYHVEGLYLGLQYPEPPKKEAKELLFRAKEFASLLPPLAE